MDWYFVLQPFQFICSLQRFDVSSHLQMISESVDTTRMTTFISAWWKSSYPSRRCIYNLGTLPREFTYWSHYKCLKYSGVLLTALAEKRFQRIVVLRRQSLIHLQPVIIKSYWAERFSSWHIKKHFWDPQGASGFCPSCLWGGSQPLKMFFTRWGHASSYWQKRYRIPFLGGALFLLSP